MNKHVFAPFVYVRNVWETSGCSLVFGIDPVHQTVIAMQMWADRRKGRGFSIPTSRSEPRREVWYRTCRPRTCMPERWEWKRVLHRKINDQSDRFFLLWTCSTHGCKKVEGGGGCLSTPTQFTPERHFSRESLPETLEWIILEMIEIYFKMKQA